MTTLDRAALEAKVDPKVTQLPLANLFDDPDTYQARDPEATRHPEKARRDSSKHVGNLLDAIQRNGGQIEPLIVYQRKESEFVVLDGHHRLKAFRRLAKKTEAHVRVPCRLFRGGRADARLYARTSNLKDTLNMTAGERSQNSWEMVCHLEGEWASNRKLAKFLGVNEKTVRKQRKAYTQRFVGVPAIEIPAWKEVTLMNWDAGDFDPEAHQSQVDEEAHRILTSDLGEGIRQELKKSLNRDAMVQALNVLLEDYGLEVAAPWDEFDESDEDDF